MQPRSGIPPPPIDGRRRQAQRAGRLFHGQPGKVAQHHDLRAGLVPLLQLAEGLVEGQQIVLRRTGRDQTLPELHALPVAAALEAGVPAGLLDEDVPHGPGRGVEEVAAALPVNVLFAPHQPQIGLVDQGRRLKCVARGYSRHLVVGQGPQLLVDRCHQLGGGVLPPAADVGQQMGHVAFRTPRHGFAPKKANSLIGFYSRFRQSRHLRRDGPASHGRFKPCPRATLTIQRAQSCSSC